MAEQPAAAKQQPRKNDFTFVVEMGDEHGGQIMVSTLSEVFRGRFPVSRMHERPKTMGMLDDIPGIYFGINIRASRVSIWDPLEEKRNKDQVDRLNNVMVETKLKGRGPLRFMERRDTELPADTFKTLVIELMTKVERGTATVVEGRLPTAKDLEAMDGDELYDPVAQSQGYSTPKYRKDADAWRRQPTAAP